MAMWFTALITVCLNSSILVPFFGSLPGIRYTPIGLLDRFMSIYIISNFIKIDRLCNKGRIAERASKIKKDFAKEKNPFVLITFLFLLSGGATLFVPAIWPLIPLHHKTTLLLLLTLPYLSIHLCNKSTSQSPHIITPSSSAHHNSLYPFDNKLFHPNTSCTICQLQKPARSRHCSRCGVCVARADHHCIWVNNCIGRGNHKYFLGLLLSMTLLLGYTVYLTYLAISPQITCHLGRSDFSHAEPNLFTNQNHSPASGYNLGVRTLGQIYDWLQALSTALQLVDIRILSIGLLSLLAIPFPAGLLAHHTRLIFLGMTAIESEKWKDWGEEIADKKAFLAPLLNHDKYGEKREEGRDKKSAWPKSSREVLVLTNDGLPPRNLEMGIRDVVGEDAKWRSCGSLDEVENIYDLGVWGNLGEVLLH